MTENTNNVDFGKSYKLKLLPPDTPLKIIIELINGMELSLHPFAGGRPPVAKFIEDHPELVEKVE